MDACSQLVCVFALCYFLRTMASERLQGLKVTVGPSQELVENLFDDVLSVAKCQSDETKSFHGNVSVSTQALLEEFFWSGLNDEELERGKESRYFPSIYFITNELASDVPNPGWVFSSIRTKMKWVIIPGECASC